MILIYGEARRNSREAVGLYRERYPDRYIPDHTMFCRLERNLRSNMDIFSGQKGISKQKTTADEKVAEMMQYFQNHHIIQSQASRQLNVSYQVNSESLRVTKNCKMNNLQLLIEFDSVQRLSFVAEMMIKYDEKCYFLNHILWTDESYGKPNRKKDHYWADENTYIVNQVQSQGHYGIKVWCGITGRHLVGPYFFEGTLTGNRYITVLINTLSVLLENVPVILRRHMWYQHDGTLPHTTPAIREYLNQRFQ